MGDRLEDGIETDVSRFGRHARFVVGDQAFPSFTYSIGFGFDRGWPEVVAVGAEADLAHAKPCGIGEDARRPAPGMDHDGIPDGFRCRFPAVTAPDAPMRSTGRVAPCFASCFAPWAAAPSRGAGRAPQPACRLTAAARASTMSAAE